jgi:hypothetical protein
MDREASMGSGVIRVQLPGSFGAIGHNVEHMPDMPKLEANSDSQLYCTTRAAIQDSYR